MKSIVSRFVAPLTLAVTMPLALVAQIISQPASSTVAGGTAPLAEADQEWQTLIAANKAAEGAPSEAGKRGRSEMAAQGKSAADRARQFYSKNPNHPQAGEAHKLEVFSLILSAENGDAGATNRLDGLVGSLRKDQSASVKVRAQVAAAYDFTASARAARTHGERIAGVESVARGLVKEFPGEPQGYEALLALCQVRDTAGAKALAAELVASGAPDEIKLGATLLLQRLALVGHSLAEALGREGSELVATLPAGKPVVVYSWATWAPGSLELGRMIQARRFAAIGICVDAQVGNARQAAQQAGLGGQIFNDGKGVEGGLAARLGFSGAGHIYLADAAGVIRDVRGGDELETKLTALGFSTPALVVPALSELLRR